MMRRSRISKTSRTTTSTTGRDASGKFRRFSNSEGSDGIEALVSDITRAADAVRPAAAGIVVDVAAAGAATMRELIPQRSGHTRDSITVDDQAVVDEANVSAAYGADPGADGTAFVAHFIEYGTAHQPPRPFAEASVQPHLDTLADRLADAAAEALGR